MDQELELGEELHQKIKAHCAQGDVLAEAQRFEDAIAEYNKAWLLIPEPKKDWNAATWILAAIADSAYLGGYATTAREALEYVDLPRGHRQSFHAPAVWTSPVRRERTRSGS